MTVRDDWKRIINDKNEPSNEGEDMSTPSNETEETTERKELPRLRSFEDYITEYDGVDVTPGVERDVLNRRYDQFMPRILAGIKTASDIDQFMQRINADLPKLKAANASALGRLGRFRGRDYDRMAQGTGSAVQPTNNMQNPGIVTSPTPGV